jgi:hypothetical protein
MRLNSVLWRHPSDCILLIALIANLPATKRSSVKKITTIHVSDKARQTTAGKIRAKEKNDIARQYPAQGGDVDRIEPIH